MKNMDNENLETKERDLLAEAPGDKAQIMSDEGALEPAETVSESSAEAALPEIESEKTDDAAEPDKVQVALKTEKKKTSVKESFRTKNVRYGSYSAVMIAIVIVLAVVVNLIASALPTGLQSFDLSSDKIYSIGKQTEKVLDQLEDPITITVFSEKKSAQETLVRLLDHYEENKNVTVEYIDPALNPSTTAQYSSLSQGSVVVKSGSREQTIDAGEIFVSDYSSYYTTGNVSTTFDGEGQITSAIQYVTSAQLPKLYTVTGHGEQTLSQTLSSLISKQNIETAELNLMTDGAIPEDCDCLLIYAPASDYTEEEAQMILSYLDQGGKVIAVQYYTEERLANYESVLNAYGLRTEEGIVMETANHYYQYPMYVIPGIASSEITQDLASANMNILMPNALGMVATEEEGTEVTPLLQTSSGAYLKKVTDGQLNSTEKEDGDEVGQFLLAALGSKTGTGTGELIAISSSSLIDDSVTQSFSLGNLDLFTSCLSHMTSEDGVETVSIDAKSMTAESITVSSFQAIAWGAILVLLIPVAVIVTGLVIWLRRRKK